MSSIAFRSSATLLNGQITLPLRRFSYCTVLHLKSPSQWNHTKAQKDLFAVIDTVRELGVSEQMMEKHVLRVFNGRDMLVGEIILMSSTTWTHDPSGNG